jgi:sugar phosphate isomerase/epimerase
VCHIHIKDWTCTGERYLQPGQGEVDFAAFFAGLHRHAYTGALSLEASGLHEDGSVDMGALCAGAAFIRQMVSKQSATLF